MIAVLSVIVTSMLFTTVGFSTTEIVAKVPYPKGPLVIGNSLYIVSYGDNQVYHSSRSTTQVVWEAQPGKAFNRCGPASVIDLDKTRFMVSCYDTHELKIVTPGTKKEITVTQTITGEKILSPNDFAKDSSGGIYITSSGSFDRKSLPSGSIFYFGRGQLTKVPQIPALHYSNGLAIINDGKTLLVSEHLANKITAFDIIGDGRLANPGLFADLNQILPQPNQKDPLTGPDGLAVGPKTGRIYVAQYGASRIIVLDDKGSYLKQITVAGQFVTNLAFRDQSERQLYATVEFDANNP